MAKGKDEGGKRAGLLALLMMSSAKRRKDAADKAKNPPKKD